MSNLFLLVTPETDELDEILVVYANLFAAGVVIARDVTGGF